MKYFSCQPDSHNAFGSLTNGILTYFTVDCARYKRLAQSTGTGERGDTGAGASPDTSMMANSAWAEGLPSNALAAESAGLTSSSSLHAAGPTPSYGGTYYEPHFSTDTRMHVQRTLTLPAGFQATQCCFSMANRAVFGTDMAFVGAANGLLALVVLREDLVLYVRGRDPQSLREQLQRGHRDPAAPASGGAVSSSSSSSAAAAAVSGGQSHTSPAALPSTGTDGRPLASHSATRSAPSTITWMRDKPLVLVGFSNGRVEWYRVTISAARQQELLDPAKELPFGASVTPGAFAYQALNRDAHTGRVAHVVVGGHKDGLRAEMVASCHLPDAGALFSSDYFPANGTVAVAGEHGGVYLFHTDQLEAPLCELNLGIRSAGFLYCHPFLPLVGVVSAVVWADNEEAQQRQQRRRGTPTTAVLANALAASPASPPASSASAANSPATDRSADAQPTASQRRARSSSPLRRGWRSPHNSSPAPPGAAEAAESSAVAARANRHVGWHDDDARDGTAGRNGASRARTTGLLSGLRGSVFTSGEAVHAGCVVTLVEYYKEAPPRQLARAWTGDQPLAPTHRLAQVLQHCIEGAASPRYGSYYNFSWKFSFDLELVIGNLGEGALRVVRISRGPPVGGIHSSSSGSNFAMSTTYGAGGGGSARSPTQDGLRGRADATAEGEDGDSLVGTERDSVAGTSCAASSTATTTTPAAGAPPAEPYRVVQEYAVRLPLHSLVNVEYVSAATSALSALDPSATAAGNAFVADSAEGGENASVVAFQREAGRMRRHSALLAAAAAAAVDPRARLGFSAASSSSGLLCQPANAFWAGLAVVSLPRHSRHKRLSAAATGRGGVRAGGEGDEASAADPFEGSVLDTFYGAAGCARGQVGEGGPLRLGGGHGEDRGGEAGGGGLQLRENALAAAMLQPLRGEYALGGTAARRQRRHTTDTTSNSLFTGTDAASSSRMQSSSSTTATTAHHSQQQQQRRRRRDRDPLAPAITVPSYAARSTQNEIANAVLIAADHRVDLHQRLRIGPGNVSCVVGMNAAGEVASVPIEVRAVATWHEEGSVFVGLGPTTCAADLVSIQSIERVMRRRHAAGFGISAVANLAAAKKVGGYGSVDVVLLFTYVATLESVRVVASTGAVPSLLELLKSSSAHGKRTSSELIKSLPRFAPRLRMAMHGCVFHGDFRRLLVLQVLGWLPPSLAEEWTSSPAAATAPGIPEWLRLPFEAAPVLTEANTNFEIERAVAVEVTHARYGKAADLLLRFHHRCPSYRAMATLLQRPADALAMVHDSDPRVCESFRASLTPWMLVVFHCLCSNAADKHRRSVHGEGTEDDREGGESSVPVQPALPYALYRHPALFLWDRVALAVVMESDAKGALAHVLRDILLPQCNPLQALLLHQGVHLRTSAAMQEMVDCTGDFQLGACLFARVGVLTTAAALAFPFLLDGVVQASPSAAAAAAEAGLRGGSAAEMESGTLMSPHHIPSIFDNARPDDDDADYSGDRASAEEEEEGRPTATAAADGVGNSSSSSHNRRTASPYAYLYGGVSGGGVSGGMGGSRQGSRRASPHAAAAAASAAGLLDSSSGVLSHTARLVRNSALPPPPLPLSPLPAKDVGGRAYAAASSSQVDLAGRRAGGEGAVAKAGGWAALYRAREEAQSGGSDVGSGSDDSDDSSSLSDVFEDDGGDGEVADVPWVWWAAAYRSFLDDEQAFVRRTTFDVECQQLRSQAVAREAALPPRERSHTGEGRRGRRRGAGKSAGDGAGAATGAAAGLYALARRRSPSLRELDGANGGVGSSGHLLSSDGRLTYAGSRRGNGRLPHDLSSSSILPTPLTGSLSLPYSGPATGGLSRGCGRGAGYSQAELVMGTLAMRDAATMQEAAAAAAATQDCVCGERHEGTQLIRSLLNMCSTTTTRCSVCLEPVRLGACDVGSAFAWCTSCRHGGHAHHLQDWFRTHRRCPVNGCDCHCDEDSSLF